MLQAFNDFWNPTPEARAAMELPRAGDRFKAGWQASWRWPVLWRRAVVLFVGFQLVQIGYFAVRGFQTVALERQAGIPDWADVREQPAPARSRQYTVWGIGNRTCGAWTAAHDNESDRLERITQMAWLGGYMSAFNNYGPLRSGAPRIDFDGMEAWITRYCRQYPLDRITRAAAQLAIDLQRREVASELPRSKR
jgi:hypothetical protein